MAQLFNPGNKMPLGQTNAPAGGGVQDEIISKTKDMAFPSGPVISLENFDHYGPAAAGTEQSFADMNMLTGKELQESYRVGLSDSQRMVQKVTDR
jgi:hypothetical protein